MIYETNGVKISLPGIEQDSYMDDILARQILKARESELTRGMIKESPKALADVLLSELTEINPRIEGKKDKVLDSSYEDGRVSEVFDISDKDRTEFGSDEYEND